MSGLTKIESAILLDTYESILTDKQRQIMRMYCDMDYSLAEIAEQMGISRQGVHDAIVNSEKTLTDMENKLHVLADDKKIRLLLQSIKKLAEVGDCTSILQLLSNQCEE